jgi:hypothetical protein
MKTKEVLERVPFDLVLRIQNVLDEISCDDSVGKADFVEALVLNATANIGTLFAIKGAQFDTPERRLETVELFSTLMDEAIEAEKKVKKESIIMNKIAHQ